MECGLAQKKPRKPMTIENRFQVTIGVESGRGFGGLPLSTNWWAIRIWKYIGFVSGMSYVVLPLKTLESL